MKSALNLLKTNRLARYRLCPLFCSLVVGRLQNKLENITMTMSINTGWVNDTRRSRTGSPRAISDKKFEVQKYCLEDTVIEINKLSMTDTRSYALSSITDKTHYAWTRKYEKWRLELWHQVLSTDQVVLLTGLRKKKYVRLISVFGCIKSMSADEAY